MTAEHHTPTDQADADEPAAVGALFHGTTTAGLELVEPAEVHGRAVTFRSDTDPTYAYATGSLSAAWVYAEKAWHATSTGIPRVYQVEATGPVETDPSHDEHGRSRSTSAADIRSRDPFRVVRELPMPAELGEPADWA